MLSQPDLALFSVDAGRTPQAAGSLPHPLDDASIPSSTRSKLGVLLFAPNLIDYLRVAVAYAAFGLAGPAHPNVFTVLYFICFALDAVDGYAARQLNQVRLVGLVSYTP